jgi:16S rRNA pseudouridine516 synthase
MQLERILHAQGFGTRKECRHLIRHGLVRVAERTVEDPAADFPPEDLVLAVDGQDWVCHDKVYLLLHKPLDAECSHQPQAHPSIYDLLPPQMVRRGVQSVGRLDHDTTGLLLLSDDGQFIHRWSSGKKRVPKTYLATLKHEGDSALVDRLLAGVQLRDEPAPIAAAACTLADADGRQLRLTVTEGKYHQVRRMIAAAGNRVDALHRESIGGLALPPELAPGTWRWLVAADLERLADYLVEPIRG